MKKFSLLLLTILYPFSTWAIAVEKKMETYPSGKVKAVYSFYLQAGKIIPHGTYKEYYIQGSPLKKIHYKHGVLHGKATEYSPNGNKKWTGKYKEGVKIGKWHLWDENGNKKIKGYFDKKGYLKKVIRHHPNGKKKSVEYFKNGQPFHEKKWDINGNLLSKKYY